MKMYFRIFHPFSPIDEEAARFLCLSQNTKTVIALPGPEH
jgi:hypothetical protein